MKLLKISAVAALACVLTVSVNAEETKPKRELKANMNVVYNQLPPAAENITDAFANGMFYGRLRANAFQWDWETADNATNKDNKAFGLGGSLVYKSAPLYGTSITTSLYYSSSPFADMREDEADATYVKSGKDTFSRYNVKEIGDWEMAVLAEAYVQYNIGKTDIKLGRQIFESALTASNDTKMIPNTFEGISIESKDVPQTTLKAAYLTAQKLRDHTTFHDVITFNDGTSNWNNNDDSGVHQGISYANLKAAGKDVDNSLVVVAASNKSIPNLTMDVTYTAVPELISSVIGELNYKIPVGDFTITPGVRYMQQMDDGAGAVGGASLNGGLATWTTGDTKGYKDAKSLESSLVMARLVVNYGALKVMGGYSKVADEGDIVAPWRNFPTGGYTRAMAQLNWKANAETMMGEVAYDFGKAKILKGFSTMARYAIQGSDEAKQAAGGQADLSIIHVDLKQQINPQLDAKFRVAIVDSEKRILGSSAGTDVDTYNEYRFELNYLF